MNGKEILRVRRTKEQAKEAYDRISRIYDLLAGPFEKGCRDLALRRLNIKEGEVVLEVGFGTGDCLRQIAKAVGSAGRVYGIDISSEMLKITRNRLEKAGLLDRVKLTCGDAMELPYEDGKFDAVFMSFTLELFDTPEIPKVLAEIKRTLKSGGRLGVVGMSKENGDSLLLKLYEWVHEKIPQYVDCRPIYIEKSLRETGFEIKRKEKVKMVGLLPGEIVVGVKG